MKILIIRYSSIGDIVLTTPMIRNLHSQIPKARLHFLCKEEFSSILAHHPLIEKLHCYPRKKSQQKDGKLVYFKFLIQRTRARRTMRKILVQECFDWIVDVQSSVRSRLLTSFLIQQRGEQNLWISRLLKLRWKRWLYCTFKWGNYPQKETHVVLRMFEAIQSPKKVRQKRFCSCYFRESLQKTLPSLPINPGKKIKNDHKGLDFYFPEISIMSKKKNLEKKLSTIGIVKNAKIKKRKGNFLVWILGGSYETKKYPVEQMKQFVKQSALDYPIVLLGGAAEENTANALAKLDSRKIINLCNQCSIAGSAQIISQASLVISHDTGLMHIAAALKKELIAIYGNTAPLFGFAPYYGSEYLAEYRKKNAEKILQTPFQIIEMAAEKLPCRPCSHLGYRVCPRKHFLCMRGIPVRRIESAVRMYIHT